MKQHFETRAVHGAVPFDPLTGAVSTPIYQSATYRHPRLNETTGYDYARLQNPTREVLEKTMADLEEGAHGYAFSSGMAAISTLLKLFRPGDHIILSDDLYGGTFRSCEEIYKPYGLKFSYVDGSDIGNIEAAILPETKALFIETPTNPMMKVTDIRKAVALAAAHRLLTIVDNTFMSPYNQKPLTLGADVVVHSATKYLAGHNDTLAGILVLRDSSLAEQIDLIKKSEGAALGALDSWLVLRGLKTLALRMERQQDNALQIARWLKAHPAVTRVHFVGLEDDPGHEVNRAQSNGPSAMISFAVRTPALVEQVLERVQTIMFAESLGGTETLITYPTAQTHSAIPEDIRIRLGVTDTLLRLSVGVEHVEDLIRDLTQALDE